MKIDRLMGMLTVLLRSPGVTAPELAERFEVSRRTITRDMEALCRAGVPIVSRQGAGGGFSVQPGYRVPDDLFVYPAGAADAAGGGAGRGQLVGRRKCRTPVQPSAGGRSRLDRDRPRWAKLADKAALSTAARRHFGGKLRAHRLLRAGERRNARGGAASPRLQMGRVVSDRVVQAAAGFPSVQAGANRVLRNIGGAL